MIDLKGKKNICKNTGRVFKHFENCKITGI